MGVLVHASTAARFEESYKKIAERLQLTGRNEPKADTLNMVYGWLSILLGLADFVLYQAPSTRATTVCAWLAKMVEPVTL